MPPEMSNHGGGFVPAGALILKSVIAREIRRVFIENPNAGPMISLMDRVEQPIKSDCQDFSLNGVRVTSPYPGQQFHKRGRLDMLSEPHVHESRSTWGMCLADV
jgi:hypothetical protein